jgi:hypothetical protein
MATSKPAKPEVEQPPEEVTPPVEETAVRPADAPAERPAEETGCVPGAPSFGLCAGTVADLEQVDKTVDPFTGNVVTRADVK